MGGTLGEEGAVPRQSGVAAGPPQKNTKVELNINPITEAPGPSRRRDPPTASSAQHCLSDPRPGRSTASRGWRPTTRGPNHSPQLLTGAQLPPLDPIFCGALPDVGFFPALAPRVPQHPHTHRGSLRLSLRVRFGLAFRADDGGVQSTLRVRPPS
ncbi:hypothetical protein NDU88_003474 [Pleurodeles waltl]|uniref:Uncharacterized protein n=1 Tax=Pleurodeles waltl TaxID=8319 RepID=A0AAV7UYK5_PLEWA|nr:hypothetical protein NDU88_003474 [Pleurodeles waltl]